MRFLPTAFFAVMALCPKANAHPIGPGVNDTVVIPLPGGWNETMTTIPIPRHVVSFKTHSPITCDAGAENTVQWSFLGEDAVRCLGLSAMTGLCDPWHLPRAISNVTINRDCTCKFFARAPSNFLSGNDGS